MYRLRKFWRWFTHPDSIKPWRTTDAELERNMGVDVDSEVAGRKRNRKYFGIIWRWRF